MPQSEISPTVIAKLDSGHRGSVLSVPERWVLAGALEVPPVALLFPELPNGDVALLPYQHHQASEDAMRWFCGESGTLPFAVLSDEASSSDLAPNDKAQLVEAVRDRRVLLREALAAQSDAIFRQEVPELLRRIRDLSGRIRALGGVVNDDRWAVLISKEKGGEDD